MPSPRSNPQYSNAIIAGAKTAFLQGDDWAYAAGVAAIVLGAALVWFMFPKHERELELLASYAAEDQAAAPARSGAAGLEPAAAES